MVKLITIIGITVFAPMTKEDFEKYKDEKKKEANAKNAYQKKHLPKKGIKFPITTIEINDNYKNKISSIKYLELDFLSLLATCSILLFLVIQIIRIYDEKAIKDVNLAFSLEFFTSVFALYYLLGIAFENGFFKTDEAKVTLFLGFQSWIFSFVILYILPQYFDFGLPNSYNETIKRINEGLKIFEMSFDIDYKYFCGLMAIIASLITMAQTNQAVSFTYYYHLQTQEEYNMTLENSKTNKLSRYFLHIGFLFPLLISILFVPALLKNFIVPMYISDTLFDFIKIMLVFLYIVLKLSVDRKEFQYTMYKVYYYIQALPQNATDQYYNLMSTQMLDKLNRVWIQVFGYIGSAIVPALMCILSLHKGIYLFSTEKIEEFNFKFLYENSTAEIDNEKVNINPFEVENL